MARAAWPGPGPVFEFERIVASRHWRGYALRSLFVAALLAALVLIWTTRVVRPGVSRNNQLAQLGEMFFIALTGTQLTLVMLAAPAATAGAICLDRARGTLAHLLMTDLSDAEVVLGKLAARLAPVLGLVACALPMLALLTLLGGVDPRAILGAFAVTVGVAVLGCCLALAFSIVAGKTHEALAATYAVWCLWLIAGPLARRLRLIPGWAGLVPHPPLAADPFHMVFAPYWSPRSVGPADYLGFLAATLAVSAALAVWATLRVRASCTRDAGRSSRRRRPVVSKPNAIGRAWRSLAPGLDSNPVLWREWHRARPSRMSRVVVTLYFGLSAVATVLAIGQGMPRAQHLLATVNGVLVAIGLLLLSVVAATSLSEERTRGSLDVLLATPLPTRQIVLGKWLGTFRLVPPLAVLPVTLFLFGPRHGVGNLGGALFMLIYMLCGGAAVTSLGLALATWCSRLGRAVGLTVTVYVLVTVGWFFIALLAGPRGYRGEGWAMGSPFGWGVVCLFEFCSQQPRHNVDLAIAWTVLAGLVALGLLGATLASFNRCLGRVEGDLRARTEPGDGGAA
jgi:ABC-type transport system involved in multi-copper enzyme maturation permease subunit